MKEQKRVPKLRFVEFSDEWEDEKVGMLGTFKGGGTPSTNKSEYWQGETPWISSSDIKENDIHNINISRYLSELAITESATKVIPKGSILFVARVGIGKVAVANQDLCTSQDFANLIPRKDDSYYIAYYFISKSKLLFQHSQGTSIKGFTTGDLKSIPINIPTLPEQQKIASFLSSVDKKIAQLQQKKRLLEDYKKGVMQQIFPSACSGQVPQLRFTKAGGSAYPNWEEKRLGDVCEIVGGGTPKTSKGEYWNGNIQWFTPTEIKKDFVNESIRKLSKLGLKKSSAKILPVGTILMTTRATIGEVAITLKECTTNQGFQSLIVNKDNNNVFIFNWVKMNKHQLLKRANGSTFSEISKSEIEKIKVSTPSKEEQTKIADFLSVIDKKIAVVQAQIEHTQQFKKGLLQQMFV
ncbi:MULTISPECIES: restriction endonuclease subunit S [Maribacter]|uniref:Restriction endonuclease subunit S n=1 Tax=Maribacter flavus TaxID=1658664 RepID=A0ABU7IKF1_9FLAO|nr:MULTISPECIES: restriction endonuclease subunit S [Maribacter]MDC6406322.1 restriction endonuclease subunit S [Maribacter sp. PR66]MEE1973442.1 restriction endonuclease subunit S [Maribacter flavus]